MRPPILERHGIARRRPVWFYELHEGDDDLSTADVLLAHDTEYDEQELLDLVLEARTAVVGTFTEDTLSEAIANELARRHGFLVVDDTPAARRDDRLRSRGRDGGRDRRAWARQVPVDDDYRSLLIDVDKEDRAGVPTERSRQDGAGRPASAPSRSGRPRGLRR